MNGPPMNIHIAELALAKGIIPKKVFAACKTPLPLQKGARYALKIAVKNKVVEAVPGVLENFLSLKPMARQALLWIFLI